MLIAVPAFVWAFEGFLESTSVLLWEVAVGELRYMESRKDGRKEGKIERKKEGRKGNGIVTYEFLSERHHGR